MRDVCQFRETASSHQGSSFFAAVMNYMNKSWDNLFASFLAKRRNNSNYNSINNNINFIDDSNNNNNNNNISVECLGLKVMALSQPQKKIPRNLFPDCFSFPPLSFSLMLSLTFSLALSHGLSIALSYTHYPTRSLSLPLSHLLIPTLTLLSPHSL